MPNTDVFYGRTYSYIGAEEGGINVAGRGDTADITFTDKDRNETKAQFKVYTLSKLKKSMEFKCAFELDEIDSLVHDWKTMKSDNTIIKYAGNEQQAFVFTSKNNLAEDYKKLFRGSGFYGVDYFVEKKFAETLQRITGLSIRQLKAMPGMDVKRLNLLVEHRDGMEMFLSKGMTIEQLAQANITKLEKYLESSYCLVNALKFVTIQQILGVSHTPPSIVDSREKRTNNMIKIGGFGSATLGEYSYKHDSNSIEVTHDKSKAELSLSFGRPKNLSMLTSDLLATLEPEMLVHQWYTLLEGDTVNGQTVKVRYCPGLQLVHKETTDSDFPVSEFNNDYRKFMLITSPYYNEVNFAEFLNEFGTSFEKLRAMQGMSEKKLEVMQVHKDDIKMLLKQGMTFSDFAKIDEKRFVYVVSDFHQAKSALEFVDPYELFGLGSCPQPQRHFGLFDKSDERAATAGASQNYSDDERDSCVMM